MAGSNVLSSGLREDDGEGVVAVYPYKDCTYVVPDGTGNSRVALPAGYKVVVVEAVGGDAWINQGAAAVTAAAPAAGAGIGRYLAQGKEVPLPATAGGYLAARAVSGTPTVYLYGLGS